MRHPILYAEQVWRRQRFFVLILVVFATGMVLVLAANRRFNDPSLPFYVLYLAVALLIFGGFQVNRLRSYVQVVDGGLKVSRLVRSAVIGYDNIRAVRVQSLRTVMQDMPRRTVTPAMKDLLDKPALLVRLDGGPEEIAAITRRLNSTLGTRLVFDSTAAFPVKDPAAVVAELTPHLPIRAQANLGGARRKRRR